MTSGLAHSILDEESEVIKVTISQVTAYHQITAFHLFTT